jgi:hypothetical protein
MPKPVTTTLLPIKNITPLEQDLLGGVKKKSRPIQIETAFSK